MCDFCFLSFGLGSAWNLTPSCTNAFFFTPTTTNVFTPAVSNNYRRFCNVGFPQNIQSSANVTPTFSGNIPSIAPSSSVGVVTPAIPNDVGFPGFDTSSEVNSISACAAALGNMSDFNILNYFDENIDGNVEKQIDQDNEEKPHLTRILENRVKFLEGELKKYQPDPIDEDIIEVSSGEEEEFTPTISSTLIKKED